MSLFVNIAKFVFIREYRIQKMVFYSTDKNGLKIIGNLFRKRLVSKYKIELRKTTAVGRNVRFPHPQNIVLGGKVIIGDNCTIYQDVTIGQNRNMYPRIEDNVIIYPGAKIFGNILIESGAVIGANSVVAKDVPANAVVAGIPAQILFYRSELDEFY